MPGVKLVPALMGGGGATGRGPAGGMALGPLVTGGGGGGIDPMGGGAGLGGAPGGNPCGGGGGGGGAWDGGRGGAPAPLAAGGGCGLLPSGGFGLKYNCNCKSRNTRAEILIEKEAGEMNKNAFN